MLPLIPPSGQSQFFSEENRCKSIRPVSSAIEFVQKIIFFGALNPREVKSVVTRSLASARVACIESARVAGCGATIARKNSMKSASPTPPGYSASARLTDTA